MTPNNLTDLLIRGLGLLFLGLAIALLIGLLGYGLVVWWRWRDREKRSLNMVTLLVAVPNDNEVKIDAMEQIISVFSNLYSSAKFKFLQFFKSQPNGSLEIVGTSNDIRFYVCVPKNYKDMVEKHIYSVYAGADIREVDDPNIYTEEGKVEYAWLGLKKSPFYPLKTYREIPTDPLASITSVLSKLS